MGWLEITHSAAWNVSLVVLSAQSGDDDRQELLPRHLGIHGEGGAHLGGDDDGQAVGQQLHM